ncbi:unnamed protein product [Amoebophrya sp. A120]|nr:unnamed protein product [Amoebophrya sp. A120]|eukprot:GSA120T00005245001.1
MSSVLQVALMGSVLMQEADPAQAFSLSRLQAGNMNLAAPPGTAATSGGYPAPPYQDPTAEQITRPVRPPVYSSRTNSRRSSRSTSGSRRLKQFLSSVDILGKQGFTRRPGRDVAVYNSMLGTPEDHDLRTCQLRESLVQQASGEDLSSRIAAQQQLAAQAELEQARVLAPAPLLSGDELCSRLRALLDSHTGRDPTPVGARFKPSGKSKQSGWRPQKVWSQHSSDEVDEAAAGHVVNQWKQEGDLEAASHATAVEIGLPVGASTTTQQAIPKLTQQKIHSTSRSGEVLEARQNSDAILEPSNRCGNHIPASAFDSSYCTKPAEVSCDSSSLLAPPPGAAVVPTTSTSATAKIKQNKLPLPINAARSSRCPFNCSGPLTAEVRKTLSYDDFLNHQRPAGDAWMPPGRGAPVREADNSWSTLGRTGKRDRKELTGTNSQTSTSASNSGCGATPAASVMDQQGNWNATNEEICTAPAPSGHASDDDPAASYLVHNSQDNDRLSSVAVPMDQSALSTPPENNGTALDPPIQYGADQIKVVLRTDDVLEEILNLPMGDPRLLQIVDSRDHLEDELEGIKFLASLRDLKDNRGTSSRPANESEDEEEETTESKRLRTAHAWSGRKNVDEDTLTDSRYRFAQAMASSFEETLMDLAMQDQEVQSKEPPVTIGKCAKTSAGHGGSCSHPNTFFPWAFPDLAVERASDVYKFYTKLKDVAAREGADLGPEALLAQIVFLKASYLRAPPAMSQEQLERSAATSTGAYTGASLSVQGGTVGPGSLSFSANAQSPNQSHTPQRRHIRRAHHRSAPGSAGTLSRNGHLPGRRGSSFHEDEIPGTRQRRADSFHEGDPSAHNCRRGASQTPIDTHPQAQTVIGTMATSSSGPNHVVGPAAVMGSQWDPQGYPHAAPPPRVATRPGSRHGAASPMLFSGHNPYPLPARQHITHNGVVDTHNLAPPQGGGTSSCASSSTLPGGGHQGTINAITGMWGQSPSSAHSQLHTPGGSHQNHTSGSATPAASVIGQRSAAPHGVDSPHSVGHQSDRTVLEQLMSQPRRVRARGKTRYESAWEVKESSSWQELGDSIAKMMIEGRQESSLPTPGPAIPPAAASSGNAMVNSQAASMSASFCQTTSMNQTSSSQQQGGTNSSLSAEDTSSLMDKDEVEDQTGPLLPKIACLIERAGFMIDEDWGLGLLLRKLVSKRSLLSALRDDVDMDGGSSLLSRKRSFGTSCRTSSDDEMASEIGIGMIGLY